MNKVTVFRTLKLLEEVGFVQKLAHFSRADLYIYIPDIKGKGWSSQPKFKCRKCHFVEILPELPKKYINGLSCFGGGSIEVTIEGICSKCN